MKKRSRFRVKYRLPLRVRLALWSGGLSLILSFVLLFFVNVVALSSFPRIIRNSHAISRSHTQPPRRTYTLFGTIFQRPLPPLEGALLLELQSISLTGLGIVALLSGAGAYWLAGRTLRPLRQVNEAAQRISARTLDTRLALQGPSDEVKVLADTFDAMLERLQLTFEQQHRFVADVAHELRTPLASLRTSMEVVISDPDSSLEDYRAMADAQEAALTRLECLVADLLLLAKSEQPLSQEAVALTPLIEQVCSDLEHEATTRQVCILLDGDADIVVQGNEALLARVFSNLVQNAIYYNHAGGEVRIVPGREDQQAVVRVSDTGIGMSLEEQTHIFERFYRIDSSRARHTGGAGLGLSIVSAIMHRHGGSIQVESTPGCGSTFTIYLPLVCCAQSV